MPAKLLIIGGLILLFNGLQSAWVKAGEDKLKLYNIESKAIILHLDDRLIAKELYEYKSVRSGGTAILSISSEYDCKKEIVSDLGVDKVAGRMNLGKIIELNYGSIVVENWRSLLAGDM